jgi:hypothetical protein
MTKRFYHPLKEKVQASGGSDDHEEALRCAKCCICNDMHAFRYLQFLL